MKRGSPEDNARRANMARERRERLRAIGITKVRTDEERARHAELERARRKTISIEVKQRELERQREYRDKNRERFRTYSREHQRKRRAKLKALGITDPHAPSPDYHRAYRARDPVRYAFMKRRHTYKISIPDQQAMLVAQNQQCANLACLVVLEGRTMQLDHCHKTNKVRSFLCGDCNAALGRMDDNSVKLRGLADYIERHQES